MRNPYVVKLTEQEAYAVHEMARLGEAGMQFGELTLMTGGPDAGPPAFRRAMLKLRKVSRPIDYAVWRRERDGVA